MSRIEINPIYDERYILIGLRFLSNQYFDIPQYYGFKRLFERSLTNDIRAKHRFTTKEFCFKIAQSILTNKRIELTAKDQLRITEESLYEPNRTELIKKISIIKEFPEDYLEGDNWATFSNRAIRDYNLNLCLIDDLKSICEDCGSPHIFGDIDHFNRIYFSLDRKFRCYCPKCLQKRIPEYNTGTILSDEDISVLTGLEIFDNDHELENYLIDIESWEYRCLCHTYIHAYSNVIPIWDLCKALGIAYNSNKKIAVERVIYRDRTDSEHQELRLV